MRYSDQSIRGTKIIVEPFVTYSGKISKTEDLISNNNFGFITIGLVLLVILVIVYFIKRSKKQKYKNGIVLSNNTFLYKNKPINNLSLDEAELLTFFFKNYDRVIQMNEVVDFITKDDKTNYNTLIKKKDNILNGLKQKLAYILDIDEDELFIYQKNNEDKRIKEIQLNPQYFLIH